MPSPDSGAAWCSSSTREGPYLRAGPAQIRPADSVTEVMPSLSDNSQVTRRSSRSGPDTQVPDPFPHQAPRRVLPERVVNEQLA
jgi:hypothetical protein